MKTRWPFLLIGFAALVCAASIIMPTWFVPTRTPPKSRAAHTLTTPRKRPVPILRKGPTQRGPRGEKMTTWLTDDPQPGEANAQGPFVEAGTFNGQPYFENAAGWKLFYNTYSGAVWIIGGSLEAGDPVSVCAYQSTGGTLPGNPWSALLGSAPAPTLAAYGPPDPGFAYGTYIGSTPEAGTEPPPFAPCRATIDGVDYIVLPGLTGFHMFRLSDKTWHYSPVA